MPAAALEADQCGPAATRGSLHPGAGRSLEAVDAGHFLGGEGEAEEVDVLLDAFAASGLRDDDEADVEMPAQDHLGRGHAGCLHETLALGDLFYNSVKKWGRVRVALN